MPIRSPTVFFSSLVKKW